MNPFTRHPSRQGITYFEHCRFAMGIARRLLHSVAAFAVHALFPFVAISPRLDLEATAAYIEERNDWIESVARDNSERSIRMPEPETAWAVDSKYAASRALRTCRRREGAASTGPGSSEIMVRANSTRRSSHGYV